MATPVNFCSSRAWLGQRTVTDGRVLAGAEPEVEDRVVLHAHVAVAAVKLLHDLRAVPASTVTRAPKPLLFVSVPLPTSLQRAATWRVCLLWFS